MDALSVWSWCVRRRQILFFVGGFLFDLATLDRIDAWLDLTLQALYLSAITVLIALQEASRLGRWRPPERWTRAWEYNIDALHFFYGGLLSAYAVFYGKSTTGLGSMSFLGLVVLLMLANEMPQVQRAGRRLRLGLHAFCALSFLNYLLPVLLGRMGALVFTLALLLAAAMSAALVWILRRWSGTDEEPWALGAPAGAILVLVAALYALHLIPPVPLSLRYAGIFHEVRRDGAGFSLSYQKPPWHAFWRTDDRVFRARAGDKLACFVRIFAPTRFTHKVFLHWQHKDGWSWKSSDRIALPVQGGRGEGYRGWAEKAKHRPGRWRVLVETEDGRVIGKTSFKVVEDARSDARDWRVVSM